MGGGRGEEGALHGRGHCMGGGRGEGAQHGSKKGGTAWERETWEGAQHRRGRGHR